jgi:hypothetical protein
MKKVLFLVVFFGCLLVMPFEFALAQPVAKDLISKRSLCMLLG